MNKNSKPTHSRGPNVTPVSARGATAACLDAAGGGPAHLSPVMCFALLIVTTLGVDFLIAPYDAAKICGPSSYWVVLASLTIAVPLLLLLRGFQQRFPDDNLLSAAKKTLGKGLGTLGSLFYLGLFLSQIIIVQRQAIEFISTYFLDRTPIWVTFTFILIGIGYIAINGISAVSCLAAFVMIPTFLFRLGMNIFGLHGLDPHNLGPVFSAPVGNYFFAGLAMADLYLPFAILFLIYPLLTKPHKLNQITWTAAGSAAFLMLLGVIGTIGVFGDTMAGTFSWPIFELVRRISLRYFILDQIGLLLVIVWFTMFFVASAFYLNLLGAGSHQLFPKLSYRWWVVLILAVVEIGGLSFPDFQTNLTIFTVWRRWIIIPITAYPLLIYFIALLRGIRGVSHGK